MYGVYPFHHVKDPYLWSLHVRYMNLVDGIVCPSKMSKKVLESEGVETPITVIPHGTDIPDKVAPLPEEFTVGYLGVVGPDKGLTYLIKAWSQLDYDDAELVFAGAGTNQIKPAIQQLAGKGKFRLLGRVDNISDLFDMCSVYVQPSLNEGFGITALEAMAHGRPVIVSDGAGSADCVSAGDGFIVPAGDPDSIAGEIDWFKTNQDRIAPIGSKPIRIASHQWGDVPVRQQKNTHGIK
jgi:glycosyltransferase involved in cell wall biosynthesis